MGDMKQKKCVPCEGGVARLSQESAEDLLKQVPGWEVFQDNAGKLRIRRSWKVKNFLKGLEFFERVAEIAEAEGHHPDLHLVGWNGLSIELWTHSIGGLSENDFILAAKINDLDVEDLVRKKKTT